VGECTNVLQTAQHLEAGRKAVFKVSPLLRGDGETLQIVNRIVKRESSWGEKSQRNDHSLLHREASSEGAKTMRNREEKGKADKI